MKTKDLIFFLNCSEKTAKERNCRECSKVLKCREAGEEFKTRSSTKIVVEHLEQLLTHLNAANAKLKQAESDANYWRAQYQNLYHLIKVASVAGEETLGYDE